MGGCCSSKQGNKQSVSGNGSETPRMQESKSLKYSAMLTQQEQLLFKVSKKNLLKFNVRISNIKAKNLPCLSSQLLIVFASAKHKIKTPIQSDNRNPHWKIQEEFEFICEAEQLKNLFFDLFVQSDEGTVIAKISLNLYQISTGPIHNDFLLDTQDSHNNDYESDHCPNFMNPTYAFSQVPVGGAHQNSANFFEEDKLLTANTFSKKMKELIPIESLNRRESRHESQQFNQQHQQQQQQQEEENFNVGDMLEEEIGVQRKTMPRSLPLKKKQKDSRIDPFRKSVVKGENKKIYETITRGDSVKGITQQDSLKLKKIKSNTPKNPNFLPSLKKGSSQLIASQHEGLVSSEGKSKYEISIFAQNVTGNSTFEQLLGHKEVEWEFVDQHDNHTPVVDFEILADEFSSSSFEFALWAVQNPEVENDVFLHPPLATASDQMKGSSGMGNQKNVSFKANKLTRNQSNQSGNNEGHSKEIYLDYKLVGNGFVSMIRFLSEDVGIKIERDQIVISETCLQEMKLWIQGRQIGRWKGEFIVTNQPFIRQLVGGVRTESGVQKATQLYIQKELLTPAQSLPRELKYIMNCKLQIEEYIIKIYDKSITLRERYKINDEIKAQLRKIISYLHIHSSAESPNLYKNEEELIRAQSILIDVAKHLLEYADQVDEILRELYYKTLILINNREELDLSYMGFDRDQAETLLPAILKIDDIKKLPEENVNANNPVTTTSNNNNKYIKKIRICLTYESFLHQTLDKVLLKLDQKGLNLLERQFVENFCSLAFFRIPLFKERLISCLINLEDDKEGYAVIANWIEDQLQVQSMQADKKNKYFLSLFEWQKDFYRYLSKQSRHQEHEKALLVTLSGQQWQHHFSKKGLSFFMFIGEWCESILKLQENYENIPWSIVPGYTKILKAFLAELKRREARTYPEALKQASLKLLHHDEILNIYVRIIFLKTNVYDSINVYYALESVNMWVKKIIEMGKKLPINFDYGFLFKGLSMILNGDHSVSISKALWFIYNSYALFPKERNLKNSFLEYVLQTLHALVTECAMYFLEFPCVQSESPASISSHPQQIRNEQIYSDYSRMMAIIEEANKRLLEQVKRNELQMEVKLTAKTLKLRYLQRRAHLKKKIIKNRLQSIEQKTANTSNSNNGVTNTGAPFSLDNSILESLDLSIISRKNSVYSLQSIERVDSNLSPTSERDREVQKWRTNEGEEEGEQKSDEELGMQNVFGSMESISNIESILSDLNKLDHEQQQLKAKTSKKKPVRGIKRRNSLQALISTTNTPSSNVVMAESTELQAISRKETTMSKNKTQQRDLEKILQNEIKLKQKKLLKKETQNKKPLQKTGIRVYRRYHGDATAEKLRIPKESLRYLPESCQEFNGFKHEYAKWINSWYKELYSNDDLTEEEITAKVLALNTPEISVKVPRDESEANQPSERFTEFEF